MKVKLNCVYCLKAGEPIGKPGDYLESPRDTSAEELKRLVQSGSADLIEPPKKSERD